MKSEISRNILLIALAVRLQRLVKNLPNNHVSAERISRKSLAESYFSEELSKSCEGARKKASRYMDVMEQTFGLDGLETSGYVMARKFETFRDMFAFWLDKISPPGKDDKRLHVMLSGLIHAIDNAFSEDPIVIPKLASQLKQCYGNKNVRDTKEPLIEMFDNYYISSWLQLIEMDEEGLAIDTGMDPLLMRQRQRSEVGGNADHSVKLARPGRIHVIFDSTLADLDKQTKECCTKIASAIHDSEIWEINEKRFLPYILCREGKRGSLIVTLRNLTDNCFEDVDICELSSIPGSSGHFTPYGLDASSWACFRQLAT